jgi:hypothetical protein
MRMTILQKALNLLDEKVLLSKENDRSTGLINKSDAVEILTSMNKEWNAYYEKGMLDVINSMESESSFDLLE